MANSEAKFENGKDGKFKHAAGSLTEVSEKEMCKGGSAWKKAPEVGGQMRGVVDHAAVASKPLGAK